MIADPILPIALQLLNESPYTFYLGGSRRMAQRYEQEYCSFVNDVPVKQQDVDFEIKVTENTDYDFYTTQHRGGGVPPKVEL